MEDCIVVYLPVWQYLRVRLFHLIYSGLIHFQCIYSERNGGKLLDGDAVDEGADRYEWLIKPMELSSVHIKGFIEPASERNNN